MSIATLLTAAGVIKNETVSRANTATRIGTMFENIINHFNKSYINFFDYASNSVTPLNNDEWTKLILVPTVGFDNNGLEINGSNQIVNTGTKKLFKLTGVASISSGNNHEIAFGVFRDGIILPASEQSTVTSSVGRADSVPFQSTFELDTDQYVQVYVKNSTGGTSITLKNINVIIDQK